MMLTKIKTLVLILLAAAVVVLFYTTFRSHKKLGYIATAKVFDEFSLKKEMENDLKKVQTSRQAYLDSLKLIVQTLAGGAAKDNDSKISEYKKMYLIKEEQFNQENESVLRSYNDKVWKQLNQYVEDFGKENGYDYLFGTSGQGNLMYAAEGDNVTDAVIDYINKKYNGK